jgi:hypothetical protein
MGSGEMIALQTSLKRFPKIPFAYKRASGPFLRQTCCPVYKQRYKATELLFGRGNFRGERRLTGFRGARKIIRIRTKCPAASNAHSLAGRLWCEAPRLAIRQFDAGL